MITLEKAPIHWKTTLQRHVTLSSTDSEIIALCTLAKEIAWVRRFTEELGITKNEPAALRCDNQSALKVVKSESATARTRHLRAQDAFVREQIEQGELQVEYVKAADQIADLLTRTVATNKFIRNRDTLLSRI